MLSAEDAWPERLLNLLADVYRRGTACASYMIYRRAALDSKIGLTPNLCLSKTVS